MSDSGLGLASADLGRLSALLEEVIDLGEAERELWLAGLKSVDERLRPALRRILSQQAARETADLLDRGPTFTAPQAEATATEFKAGERVGPYRLERMLGHGGMGEVWLAEREDGQLKRRVALKLPMLGMRRGVLVQRFARERDILGALAHPNIARLYDAGLAADGQPYLALEYVDGRPITAYCEERDLDLRARVRLLQQVLQAVQYAHANLVIHRDLKSSNVLVTAEGQAMLLDFGIAKLLQEEEHEAPETELTRLGGRAMTLDYAAPEQINGAPVSIATDVWALGVLLYVLVAGKRPFRRDSRSAQEQAILGEEPVRPSPRTLRRGLAADLDTIVLKALKKAPTERYATVNAFDQDLMRWLNGDPVLAQADSAWYRAKKFAARNRAAVATVGTVAGIVIAAGVVSIRQAQLAREQARIAQTEARTAEAVQTFLEHVFRASSGDQVDPIAARQRTARDLLDEGAARIDKELDDVPAAKLRVLKTLGDMYEDMEQLDAAVKLHERRAALAERIDGPRSSGRLRALSDLANLLVSAERLADAERVLRTAAEIQAGPGHDAEALIALDLARGWYARHRDPAEGLEPNARAVDLLRRRPPSPRLVYALDQRGGLLIQMGRYREGLAAMKEAADLATREGSRSTSTLSSTQLEMALAHWKLGELGEAEQRYRDAIDSARRFHGPKSRVYAIGHVMYGQFLGGTSRVREGAQSSGLALEVVHAWPDSSDRDSMLVNVSAMASGDYIQLGLLPEAMTLLDEAAEAAARQAGNPEFMMLLHVRRAAALLELGRQDEVQRELDQARDMALAEKVANPALLDAEVRTRITLETRRRRPGAAQDALARWQAASGRPPVPAADDVTGMHLACQVRAAQGDWPEARRLCEAALAELAKARTSRDLGVTEAQLGWLLGETLLQGDTADAAAPVLRKARERFQAVLDPERSPAIAGVEASLAEALLATGDRAGARDALAHGKAIVARHRQLSPYYTEPLQRLGAGVAAGRL